jgi:acyl-CoA reductase-like NAD-dependent aldehyde dehydrogenase
MRYYWLWTILDKCANDNWGFKYCEYTFDSEDINAVTFTGSVTAEGIVAQRATSHIKKCVLELGGSDPFIVCNDADIEKASTG